MSCLLATEIEEQRANHDQARRWCEHLLSRDHGPGIPSFDPARVRPCAIKRLGHYLFAAGEPDRAIALFKLALSPRATPESLRAAYAGLSAT